MGAYLKGFAVIAKVGSLEEQAALASTRSALSLNTETEDVTTKEDVENGVLYANEEVQYTKGTLTVEGYQKEASDALGTLDVGTEVECEFTFGKRKYSFTGLIKTLELEGEHRSVASYTMTINSKGAITMAVVA